jgi:nitrogen-specific signal transduction histidine kinase/ActR/RegA family two-component response regulator
VVGEVDKIVPFLETAGRRRDDGLGGTQKMEALGQITGGIAHELNNMLLAINLNLEALTEEVPASETTQPLFDGAQAAIEQATNVILQLLAYSRRQPLRAAEFDVNRAVLETRTLLRLVLPANVAIETCLGRQSAQVFADRSQFEMALLNLALNAGDAMPRGGTLTIETTRVAADVDDAAIRPGLAPRDYAAIAVRDTGTGMDPAVSARAFEPFFTTNAGAGRSGLGLSQVYGYAKQSGGHAEIDSGTGGTTVRLLLPCSAAAAPASTLVATPEGGSGETILVVEDTPLVRRAVTRMLGDLGYRVIASADAEAALNVIESKARIDLLFTDIMLPGALDGDELGIVARRLRPGIRVLCTSGYSEVRAEDLGRGHRFGFIAKPYSKAELARQLQVELNRQPVAS